MFSIYYHKLDGSSLGFLFFTLALARLAAFSALFSRLFSTFSALFPRLSTFARLALAAFSALFPRLSTFARALAAPFSLATLTLFSRLFSALFP